MKLDRKYKKLLSILLGSVVVLSGVLLANGQLKEAPKPQIIVENPPKISPQNPKVGEDVEITYTLRPQPFQHNISKPKEIVLVLDKSGSMDECEAHNITNHKKCTSPTKINSLKSASISFIEKMSVVEDLKISVVTYEKKATIVKGLTDIKTGKSELIQTINKISASGGTNTGGGIRKAGHTLKNLGSNSANKSIILMSDGEPTAYTTSGGRYYYTLDDNDKTSNGGYTSDKSQGRTYALGVAEVIKRELNNSNIFTIGYGMTQEGNNVMKEIHKKMGGHDENFHKTSESIDKIFDQIADDIIAQYKIEDQKLNLKLDPSVQIVSDVSYGEIIYRREEDGWYRADPVQIKFKIKCSKDGYINIVNPGSKFEYKDIFGNKVEVNIPEFAIEIGSNSKVTIEVSDSSGTINNKYDSSDNVGIRYDKEILNDFEQEYKLFGNSYANIQFEGNKINYLQYQFIKSEQKPGDLPTDGWMEISDENGGISQDVDIENQGYLTQKSYNVSHMPSMSGQTQWSNKNEVFKNPFDESKNKPAGKPTNGQDYLKKETYIDKDGIQRERWVSNTIFTNEMSMHGTDYKEANKSWGYLKVPKDGYYTFQTKSDDGLYAVLTIDKDNIFTIVDNFRPHGTETDTSGTVYLSKDKYYPIYLEYFNWGGGGCYSLGYSYSERQNPSNHRFEDIPSNYFYPSKNKTPGESGDNIFTGVAGVEFPQEVGKYYIAYKAGIKPENNKDFTPYKTGVYGPFIIDERFTLTRSIHENTGTDSSYEYLLRYTLQPNPLRITDMYRTKKDLEGNIKQSLDIQELRLKDKIAEGIYVSNLNLAPGFTGALNGNYLEGVVTNNVNYILHQSPDGELKNATYTSNPIVIDVGVNSGDLENIIFEDKVGNILYKDVSLNDSRINKEQSFGSTGFTIEGKNEIIAHGIFNRKDKEFNIISNDNGQDVIKGMYYTLGVDVDINKYNSKLKLEVPSGVEIDTNSIEVYKYNDDKITGIEENITASKEGNAIKVSGLKKKEKYIVTYTANFNSSSNINAILDNKNKLFRANVMTEGSENGGEAYLPDLF